MKVLLDLSLQNEDCQATSCVIHIVEIRALNSIYGIPGGVSAPGELLATFETDTLGVPFELENLTGLDVASCFEGIFPIVEYDRSCLTEDVAICSTAFI